MKLLESEAKTLLQKYGLKVPLGILASTAEEASLAAAKINKPVFLKAQIGVSGRGKAGGILPARNADEARQIASRMLGSLIKGLQVSRLLVEEKLEVEKQYYLSLAIDRQARRFVILASKKGGGDIEEVARLEPQAILRRWVDPLQGLRQEEVLEIAAWLTADPGERAEIKGILLSLYRAALDCDAELAELNPLAKTARGGIVAADARLIIDDNALFRQPELAALGPRTADGTPREIEAREQGLSYVDLDGDIGIIGNGAGLVMATLDLVEYYGGRPANFLDIGGGARLEVIKKGALLVMAKPEVRAVLINILGGITRCDRVAEGLVEALEIAPVKKPIAVRMMGTNETEGREILLRHGLGYYPDMESAAEAVLRS